ncbi:XIAP-associated factor 1 [Pholidichthys leucotaenia]
MSEEEPTRTCGHCHRDVAEANFALHESHCQRFLHLCPECEENVPKDQLQQHMKDQHTLVRCSKCDEKMQRCQLSDHEKNTCNKRLQNCVFCELEVPWKDLEEHTDVCGSRTERCEDCGQYVLLRNQPDHALTCSASDISRPLPANIKTPNTALKREMKCSVCMGLFAADKVEQHELECVPASWWDHNEDEEEDEDREEDVSQQLHNFNTFKEASLSDRYSQSAWNSREDPNQISTCPHCHLALPISILRWHEKKCRCHILLK